ncbi:MAG TPA: hypothetical protein VGA49_03155, partial [Patescibacteria group bacterium]
SILGLLVKTRSGFYLGRVADFDVDTVSHEVIRYYVRRPGLIKGAFQKKLLIDKKQVISIIKEAMLVEDAVVTETEEIKKTQLAALGAEGPEINMSEELRN